MFIPKSNIHRRDNIEVGGLFFELIVDLPARKWIVRIDNVPGLERLASNGVGSASGVIPEWAVSDEALHALEDKQPYDDGEDLECTHCGGEGDCMAGSDPLGDCSDDPHRCHACGGSGRRKDQTIF